MKVSRLVIPVILLALVGCTEDKPRAHFELEIEPITNDSFYAYYTLTDTSLMVLHLTVDSGQVTLRDTVFHNRFEPSDSLQLLAQASSKSMVCPNQHALLATPIRLYTDTTEFAMIPEVNHPVELDYAVRFINSSVPEGLKLSFITSAQYNEFYKVNSSH